MKQTTNTSWGAVAEWYDEYLGNEDSYQKAVIMPNLMRIVDPKQGQRIADIACGQGFFSEEMATRGAEVVGIDIAPELIYKAEERCKDKKLKNTRFIVSSAEDLSAIQTSTVETAVCVLAAQNMKDPEKMFAECARILRKAKAEDKVGFAIKNKSDPKKSPGFKYSRLVLVLNHPSFRVPQASDWYFKPEVIGLRKEATYSKGVLLPSTVQEEKQGRVVYQYVSEGMIKIDMNPGSTTNKKYTISYHRPLQVFVKWLTKNGFAITRLEEWTSHKKSQPGPRAKAEDKARKEIPLFMCIEASLI